GRLLEMTSQTQQIAAGALLVFCLISPAIGEDEDTSRSVRIIDGAPISASPPSVTANPSALPPEPPSVVSPEPSLTDKPESDSKAATSPDPRAPNSPPSKGFSPTLLPSVDSSGKVPVVANPADLSIEMLPETTVVVGSRVSFRISAKKPGFLILVDIDSA